MFLLSKHINKVNRIIVLNTVQKSNLHRTVILLDSKDKEIPNESELETKKKLRNKLSKMAFVSLKVEQKKTPNLKQTEAPVTKKIIESITEKKSKTEKISFKPFQFTATPQSDKKEVNIGLKIDKLSEKENFEKNIENKANDVAKLLDKSKDEQKKTTETILGPFRNEMNVMNVIDRVKIKSKFRTSEFSVPSLDKIKQNDIEYKKIINEKINETGSGETIVKNEDSKVDLSKPKKINLWKSSPYREFQDLSSGNGLFLFSDAKSAAGTVESPIWSMHFDQELKQVQDVPPINGFDEMILLTNQGKLWKFPIDNEQDIDEVDAKVPFHEHVFLDQHLEEFPQIEPIQQFMTLALNGISQNSFLSLKEKKDLINWYKTYFSEKLDIIKEALEAERLEASYRETIENK